MPIYFATEPMPAKRSSPFHGQHHGHYQQQHQQHCACSCYCGRVHQASPHYVRYPIPCHPAPHSSGLYRQPLIGRRYAPYAEHDPYHHAHATAAYYDYADAEEEEEYFSAPAAFFIRRRSPRFASVPQQENPFEDLLLAVATELEQALRLGAGEQEQRAAPPSTQKSFKKCCPSKSSSVQSTTEKSANAAASSSSKPKDKGKEKESMEQDHAATSSNPFLQHHPLGQFIKTFVENAAASTKEGNQQDPNTHPLGNLLNLAQVFLESAQHIPGPRGHCQQSSSTASCSSREKVSAPESAAAPSSSKCQGKQRGIVIKDTSLQEKQDEELARAIEESLKEQQEQAAVTSYSSSTSAAVHQVDTANPTKTGSEPSSPTKSKDEDGGSMIEKLQKGHEPIVQIPEDAASVASVHSRTSSGEKGDGDWQHA